MEITCNRCHQTIPEESCYCPTCGLPQLVYATTEGEAAAPVERWNEAVRDASQVEWKPALRVAMVLAIPAGVLCGILPLGLLGMVWMAAAAAWAVSLYARRQKPGWVTIGAGARIGLVTGLVGGWLALGTTGAGLYAQRFLLHQAGEMDRDWKMQLEASDQIYQRVMGQMGLYDAAQAELQRRFEMTPEGHATVVLFGVAIMTTILLLFSVAGGALGARMIARSRRPRA
ncbi:MAG TPA: hypothetical protein VGJ21_07010 [Terracidiphilus sp.]|jgi:hypothetical protein